MLLCQSHLQLTSNMNVEELDSMSSSLPILEKICSVILKEPYSAGIKHPTWAMICNNTICLRYVLLPLYKKSVNLSFCLHLVRIQPMTYMSYLFCFTGFMSEKFQFKMNCLHKLYLQLVSHILVTLFILAKLKFWWLTMLAPVMRLKLASSVAYCKDHNLTF